MNAFWCIQIRNKDFLLGLLKEIVKVERFQTPVLDEDEQRAMNSKYREVPRHPNANHAPRFYGVSSSAIAAREAENARARAAVSTVTGVSRCVKGAVVALYLAVFLDATAWATTGWGSSHPSDDGISIQVGLWQICTTRTVIRDDRGKYEVNPGDTVPIVECVFPTSVPRDWIHKALVMEIMGGFCASALFICLVMLLASFKLTMIETRSMVIGLIPLAFLAALMNLIGVLTISLNLSTIKCYPSYSVALDSLGVIFFSLGAICALLEIQGCFDPPEEEDEIIPPATLRPNAIRLAFPS